MDFIKNNIRAFRAEWMKLKRSGVFWLILGMSAFIPLLFTLLSIFLNEQSPEPDTQAWQNFIIACYRGFAGFFYPIFLILVASRLCQIENRSAGWKLIETQPIHRFFLFFAKWQVAMLLSLICLLGVLLFGLAGAGIVSLTDAGESFKKSKLDIAPILSLMIRLWISGLGILAIQYFLSLWVSNFLFSFGIGLVAVIAGSIMGGLGVAPWFPYSATMFTISNPRGSETGTFLLHHEWLSIAWMLLFLFIGYQWYRYRSWKFSFLKPPYKPIIWIAVIGLFITAFWWIEKPVQLERYGKTVIAGKINADDTINHVMFINMASLDTVAIIPVVKNSFHYTGNHDLPLGEYLVIAGRHYKNVILSGLDSIYLDWKWTKTNESVKISGTRAAENEHYSQGGNDNSMNDYFLMQYPQQFTPARYYSEVVKSAERAKRKLYKFRTVDNLTLADDYRALQEKLIAIKYLDLLDVQYPKTFAIYNPNDTLNYPKGIDQFRKRVSVSDSSLIYFPQARAYLGSYYHLKSGVAESRKDSAYFNYVLSNTSPGKTRDLLLYEELKSVLSYVRDSSRRYNFIAAYTPLINDQNLRNSILSSYVRLSKVGRGKQVPDFLTASLSKKNISFKELEGRYVVIDVWATWCIPCKKEAPYFEELAEKYTDDRIAFVSLSVDQHKVAWEMDSRDKSKRVLQLWAVNAQELSDQLAIDFIPRFILVDPRGRIVDGQMPYPSDPAFEDILRKEIPGL